jgi:hypothetical protein
MCSRTPASGCWHGSTFCAALRLTAGVTNEAIAGLPRSREVIARDSCDG